MVLSSLQLTVQVLLRNCARIRGTQYVAYRLLQCRFGEFDFRRKRALVASREDYSLDRRAVVAGVRYEQLNVMKGRSKIEKGVSFYYEATWHRRRQLSFPGPRHL